MGKVYKVLYSYDGAGNRLTEVWKDAQDLTVESFNYSYSAGNYLVSKGQESFNTGSYGQITSRTEAGVTTTYSYNPMRMMKEASEAGVTLAKYEYDALGRRIISWLDDEWRTISLWSGNDSIYELRQEWTTPPPNPPTETITRYVAVNGQYLAKLVGGYNSTQKYFHHTDIVGTVRAVTDISGAVVARYAYEPFGSLTTASGLVDGELHRFTGKPSDLETSLSYFNARYYDPTLGRFTSSDPAKDGLNWYQYCNGNPMRYVDLNGLRYSETESDYNREAAVEYALEYGNERNRSYDIYKTCSIIWWWNLKKGGWYDCTSFVSQCVLAGGFEMDEEWYFNIEQGYNFFGEHLGYSDAWSITDMFGNWLLSSGWVKKVKYLHWADEDDIAFIAQNAQIGDLLAYGNESDITHWTIITKIDNANGKVFVTYHTPSRVDEEIVRKKNYIVFFLNEIKK